MAETMMKIMKLKLLSIGLLMVVATVSQSALVKDGVWEIEAGDTWLSIMREILPQQSGRHSALIVKAQQLNKHAIAADGSLIVGKSLFLPGTKIPKDIPNAPSAGKVLIVRGALSATDEQGKTRALERGDSIYSGDTLTTGINTRTQIRFTDRSLVSLRPKTTFTIEEYSFNGEQDGSDKGVYSLLKGGFRTISGLIGKLNRDNYRVKTPVATIGIRGTHYGVTYCTAACSSQNLQQGLYGGVIDGAVVTTNSTGEYHFGSDQYFHIAGLNEVVQALDSIPNVMKEEILSEDFDGNISELDSANNEQDNKPQRGGRSETRGPEPGQGEGEIGSDVAAGLFGDKEFEGEFAGFINSELDRVGLDGEFNREDVVRTLRDIIEAEIVDAVLPGSTPGPDQRIGIAFNATAFESASVLDVFSAAEQITSAQLRDIDISNGQLDTNGNVLVRLDENGNPIFFIISSPNGFDEDGATSVQELSIFAGSAFIGDGVMDDDPAGGVKWGRWAPNLAAAQVGSVNAVNTGGTTPLALTTGLHFTVSENVLNGQNLAAYKVLRNQYNMMASGASLSNEVTLSLAGGTNPTDLNGNVGTLNSANMSINLGSNRITGLNIIAGINGDTYSLGLSEDVGLGGVLTGLNPNLDLIGSCSGGICGSSTDLSGEAAVTLLHTNALTQGIDSAPPLLGAATTFSATGLSEGAISSGSTIPDVGLSGAAILIEEPTEL